MRRQTLLATLLGAVLAVVMTWPMMSAPGQLARIDTHDGKFSVWNVAWVAHALLNDPANVFNANIFHPHQGTLAYSEANIVAGAMAAPVYAITGNPIAAHNIVVYISLVLAFVLTWHLVRRLTGSPWAGVPPAAGFAFSAYVSAHTAHVQLLLVFVVPLVLIVWHRFAEAPGLRRGCVLGATLTFAVLACAYYGIMMGLAVGFAALWFAAGQPHPRRYWLGLAAAVLVAAALVAPVALPYATMRDEVGFRSALNVEEARDLSADHRTYMRGQSGPLTKVLPESWRMGLDSYVGRMGEVLFPGIIIIGLALAGLALSARVVPARRVFWFYVGVTVMAVWASLGPTAGLYGWLADIIPFMSFLRAPSRFGVLVLMGLAVFAGMGIAAIAQSGRRRPWLVPVLLALVVIELRVSWPLRPVPPVPEAYQVLAGMPRAGTLVLHFPYRRGEWFPHVDHMFWSMWHWQPLVNGYSDFIPSDIQAEAIPLNGFPDEESFRLLRARGVRYVAIDWRTYNGPATAVMQGRFPPYAAYLRPLVTSGPVSLYEIVRWPESAGRWPRVRLATPPEIENNITSAAPRNDSASADSSGRPNRAK